LVEAQLPKDVLPGQDLGAGLQGMLVWLGHYGHLSYEKQQEWLKELGRIEVGVGTLCATTKRAATAVAQQVQELQEWVKYQPQIQVDESPWLVKGVKEWMWVFTGQRFCLFRAADTRSRAELEAVLGQVFGGVLCSDDFSVYNGYKVAAQQKCLAHMLRHFKHVIKLKPKSQAELGEVFIELIKEAFENHAQWRETKEAQSYASWAKGFKLRIADAIQTWWPKAGHAAQLLLRNLRDRAHQWWYFLDHPEVPPDNNRAERSLRLAVTKRKVCGGSRSMDGFADTATLLTVIQTCRAQGRSVIEFFRLAFSNLSDPLTLIPIPQT
jgi:transposase